MKSGKIRILKGLIAILIVAFISGIIIYLFPVFKELNTPEGQIAFRDKVNQSGVWGLLWLFGIQVAQIFLIFVPGEPIEVLAGMCYGGLWGTVFIMASAAIISTAIFFLVRKFGKNFVYQFCEEKKIKKIMESKLFQNPKKIERILLLLFMIPGTPKDLISYIAGLLPVKPLHYILIATFARFPSVISSTLAGKHLALGNWSMSVVVYVATFILIGILLFIWKHLDKTKITEETLQTLKEEKF